MRIISGKFRGRKLIDSTHLKQTLRPTTDSNRESLFNILFSAKFIKEINFELDECKIIDICCGSGAVSFEALSRGAKKAILIDNSKTHLELAKKNAQMLKIEEDCDFIFSDAKNISQNAIKEDDLKNLFFIDPPYDEDYQKIIDNLLEKNLIRKDDLIILEYSKNSKIDLNKLNLRLLDTRVYGISIFSFLILQSDWNYKA